MSAATREATRRAIEIVGGYSAVARELEVTYQAVQQWNQRGRVPAAKARALSSLTKGEVSCHLLRPDVFGADPDEASGDLDQSSLAIRQLEGQPA